ncbi:hypothetical protein U1Q18_015026 [Sarracenia purpurea var. burkii]
MGVFASPTPTTTTSRGARRWVRSPEDRSTNVGCWRLKAFWDDNRKSSGFPDVVDLESGDLESKAHSAKYQRDCRICHLNLVGSSGDEESKVAIELGCSCKGDGYQPTELFRLSLLEGGVGTERSSQIGLLMLG